VQEDPEQTDLSEELTQTRLTEPMMRTPPIMWTPLNEERNLRRDREEATPSRRAISQTYVKRQKLNSFSEQEFTDETIGATSREREGSRHATLSRGTQEPSTSHAQMLEKQPSVEVSSLRTPADQDQDIKEKYKEIKAKMKG